MKFSDPFKILTPNERWALTQSQMDAFQNAYEKLLPPLVCKIRLAVAKWRDDSYQGASYTSKSLLNFWFNQEHLIGNPDGNREKFSFFFAQREAIESIIYLYEVAKAKDKYELMRFNSSQRVSTGMFDENWTRYVVKMSTGAGKTKVMGLTLVWSYFHKLYEADSTLSKDFLVIAPNIIVLNRLRKDFDGLKMFFDEPFFPDNGFDDKDWKNDFQLTLHIQDDLKPITASGNIFLTNIHRVFLNEEPEQNFETTFLGVKPKPDADTSKGLDLGKVMRSDKIKDLVLLNDEAHHIHDSSLAWFKNIEDISNKLKLKNASQPDRQGNRISLQADYSATPKHNNGAIFVQTICDYPLVEAIKQNVVKSPVLPDEASRQKIHEKDSTDLGRFSVHTARKRLIGVQRELKASGKDFRAFELLNLGKYERQFFMDDLTNGKRKAKEDLYVDLILEAYKAKRIDGHSNLHGSKAGRFVNIGPLDVPVTQSRLMDIFEECKQKLYTQVDVLGFEFEMGLTPQFIQELKEKGVSVTLKYIPKDVFDKRAVEKGQVKFFDVAYLNTKEKIKGKSITIELTDFVTHYTQDDIEELQQTMRAGSKVVIEDGQIFKIEKDKNGIITRTVLTKNWFDWIDYWAIDFNYEDKKEIIKIKNDKGEIEEKWSGNYLFENEWQSFRTKKSPKLEFTSIAHEYKTAGK